MAGGRPMLQKAATEWGAAIRIAYCGPACEKLLVYIIPLITSTPPFQCPFPYRFTRRSPCPLPTHCPLSARYPGWATLWPSTHHPSFSTPSSPPTVHPGWPPSYRHPSPPFLSPPHRQHFAVHLPTIISFSTSFSHSLGFLVHSIRMWPLFGLLSLPLTPLFLFLLFFPPPPFCPFSASYPPPSYCPLSLANPFWPSITSPSSPLFPLLPPPPPNPHHRFGWHKKG